MDRRLRITSIVLLLALILSLGTFSVQAQNSDPGGAGEEASVVSKAISAKDQAAALKAWTRKAIASAQPMEMPMLAEAEAAEEVAAADLEAIGPAGFAASGAAAPNAAAVAKRAYAADWAAMTKATAGAPAVENLAGSSQIFDFFYANAYTAMWNMYPHKWVGRLSFTTTGGTSYCSGTAISGNVMLTAAHCVYDTTNNRWYSGWVFAPAYRNGSAPFGTFAASRCWVLTNWVNLSGSFSINGWSKYDVAVCKMGKNTQGQTLNSAVGWMGRQWNYGYVRHFFNMGYPWRDYRNVLMSNAGLYLRACAAESFTQTTDTRGMGCYYGPGISGGPWMVGYAPNVVAGYADGVNSGLYINTPNLYGPRFTSNNIVPLCAVTAAAC